MQNTVDYQAEDTIKVSHGKIIKNEEEDDDDQIAVAQNSLKMDQKSLVKQGSVYINKSLVGPSISEDHVGSELRKSLERAPSDMTNEAGEKIDPLFAAQKIKIVFKRATFDGYVNKCWKVVEVPLTILRDYTCPMSEYADWNRTRASILPLTCVWGFLYLQGKFNEEDEETGESTGMFWVSVGAYTMIPMIAVSIYIKFCTKVT